MTESSITGLCGAQLKEVQSELYGSTDVIYADVFDDREAFA